MKKTLPILLLFVLFSSHTMFIKFESYFLEPNSPATLQLFNGTFEKSENIIDRNRMLDASLLQNGQRIKVKESQWTEKDSTTFLNFKTGASGTYVAGISTKAKSLEMNAEAFNKYLKHEGIYDMLDWRKKNHEFESKAIEKYSKHVKSIFQVGTTRTKDWQTVLGYPIEFIPLKNPYALHTGDSLQVKLIFNGKPLANQLVYADFRTLKNGHSHNDTSNKQDHSHAHNHKNTEHVHDNSKTHHHGESTTDKHTHEKIEAKKKHSHDNLEDHVHDEANKSKHSHNEQTTSPNDEEKGDNETHTHASGQKLRTNEQGIVKAHISADGIWYFQTINLVHTEEEGLTHESNWATLTFEVTHDHSSDTHTHENEHIEESGYEMYIFLIGSLLLIGILFLWFNKKTKS